LDDFPYDSWEKVYREHGLYELPWDQPVINPCLEKMLKPAPCEGARALDLGCGTGTTSRHLADIGYQVDAWDISRTALSRAKKLSQGYGEKITYHCGNALVGAFITDVHYELVLDLFFLHHVQSSELDKYFDGIREALKLNGLFVVGVFKKTQDHNVRESIYSSGVVTHWDIEILKKKIGSGFVSGEMVVEIITANNHILPYYITEFRNIG
jgi:SAM-dependent methyltransferase